MGCKKRWTVVTFVAIIMGAHVESSVACYRRGIGFERGGTTPPTALLKRTSPTTVTVSILGGSTIGSDADQFCACGLTIDGTGRSIVSVDAARMVDPATELPDGDFVFGSDATVGTEFSGLEAGTWQGFLADLSTTVPDGLARTLEFDLTVSAAATNDEIIADVEAGFAGVDEANSDGTLTGNHQDIFQVNAFLIPTVSAWGFAIMALLMLTAGAIVFRRLRSRTVTALA